MSFGEGDLHNTIDRLLGRCERLADENDALRELVSDLVARIRAVEPICEMGILDARFVERVEGFGIEVDS